MASLQKFMNTYKIEKGFEFTHTTLGKYPASYYIPTDMEDDFMSLYATAIENGADLHITEKHRDISPVLIDLDFKQDTCDRRYTQEHVKHFLAVLKSNLQQYVDASDDDFKLYVMEKGIEARPNKSGGFKDGIHIVIPNVVTKPEVQFIIRENILKGDMQKIFGKLFDSKYDDIYDESVIAKNNWFLYGSKKPDEEYPWVVTTIYDASINEIDNLHSDEELIALLSIRNKFDASKVKADKLDEIKQYKDNKAKPMESNDNATSSHLIPSDLDTVHQLVMMLNPDRADTYPLWVEVGMCLKNIDERLCGSWIEFSKQSNKFNDGECENKWRGFTLGSDGKKKTEGSLRYWAKIDNPTAYNELLKKDVDTLIYSSRNETHADIAKVVHALYKDQYVCCYVNDRPAWFEFKNHHWEECPNAVSLKLKISNEVSKMYNSNAAHYHMKAANTNSETEQTVFTEVGKKLAGIATRTKMAPFKSNIISECNELFAVSRRDFYDKLDSLHHIIAFDNGVFDLKQMTFRDGQPDDFVSLSVGYDFVGVDEYIRHEILTFIASIVSCTAVLEYLLYVFAYNLSGNKFLEQAWFLTGFGRNGKGTLMTLLEQTLRKGQYYHEGDVSVLTNIRKDANSASSAIMALRNKRIAVFSESEDKDETIKVKILKQIVGRDLIQGRELYAKNNVEFRPTFSLIFLMNDMPKLSKLEPNLLDKLNVIRFPFRFCDNPKDSNEKKIDRSLKSKFEDDVRYKQQFMLILLEIFAKYGIGEGKAMPIPDEVKAATNDYFEENNEVGMWFNEKCVVTNDMKDKITPTELYQLFKHDNPMSSCRGVVEFGKLMSFNGYKTTKSNGALVYKGIKYNNNYMIDDDYE